MLPLPALQKLKCFQVRFLLQKCFRFHIPGLEHVVLASGLAKQLYTQNANGFII